MSKINELRAQRAKTWEQTKAFLDSRRNDKGVLSAEDTATYEKMEQEIVDLGREIERQERLDAFEREMNPPSFPYALTFASFRVAWDEPQPKDKKTKNPGNFFRGRAPEQKQKASA